MSTEIINSFLENLNFALRLDECLFNHFVEICSEYGVFNVQENSGKLISRAINSTFNNNKDHKYKGLILLKKYLPNCTSEIYSSHVLKWLSVCHKLIKQIDFKYTSLAADVFALLLEKSYTFADVSKDIGKQIIPNFINSIVNHENCDPKVSLSLLSCVEICMKYYSGPSFSQKEKILNILIRSLDSELVVVQKAAECISLVPSLGGGGKQGINYKTSWSQQHESLVYKLHLILDTLFENIVETQNFITQPEVEDNPLTIKLPPTPNIDSLENALTLTRRFCGIIECLTQMHLKEYCVLKQLKTNLILDLVYRGLAVTPASVQPQASIEASYLISVLPNIHIALLQLLESFILCLGKNILSESDFICKILTTVIKKCTLIEDWPHTLNKPFRNQRIAAYRCLRTWIALAGSGSNVHNSGEELISSILSDIYFKNQTVTLSIHTETEKHRKEKSIGNGPDKSGDIHSIKLICTEALLVLEVIISSIGDLLKLNTVKTVEDAVLQIFTEMIGGSLDIPIPYSDAQCRVYLYKLLLSLSTLHGTTKYVFTIFSAGLNDESTEVRLQCQHALLILDQIFSPPGPSIKFSNEIEVDKKWTITKNFDSVVFQAKEVLQSSLNDFPECNILVTIPDPTNVKKRPSNKQLKNNCENFAIDHSKSEHFDNDDYDEDYYYEDNNISESRPYFNDDDDVILLSDDSLGHEEIAEPTISTSKRTLEVNPTLYSQFNTSIPKANNLSNLVGQKNLNETSVDWNENGSPDVKKLRTEVESEPTMLYKLSNQSISNSKNVSKFVEIINPHEVYVNNDEENSADEKKLIMEQECGANGKEDEERLMLKDFVDIVI